MTHRASALAGALLVAALTSSLAGCATMTNGASGDIARSMSEVASAAESAALAYDLLDREKATDAVTGTALADMLDEVQSSATTVAELDVGTVQERRLRTEASTVIRHCADAIAGARAHLSGAGGGAGDGSLEAVAASEPLRALEAAAEEATALSDRLEPYR